MSANIKRTVVLSNGMKINYTGDEDSFVQLFGGDDNEAAQADVWWRGVAADIRAHEEES